MTKPTVHVTHVYETGDRKRPYAVNVVTYTDGKPSALKIHRFARLTDAQAFSANTNPKES